MPVRSTVNAYHDKRADFELALTIYKNYDLIRGEPQNGTTNYCNNLDE